MRTLFARIFLRHNLVFAAVLVAALAACEREGPTAVKLETPPPGPELCGICTGNLGDPGALAGKPLAVAGVVGQPTTISLEAVDRNGRAVSGASVSWAVMREGGFTNFASSTTDSSGIASVTWTLDTIAKTDTLRASLASGAAMLVTATGRHGGVALATKISGDSQTVSLGEASQPFIVKLTDRYGNPISGVGAGWIVNGGGMLSALTTVTDASGMTQVTLSTDTNAPGARQIVATYGILPATTFTLTATATTSASAARRIRVYTHPIP
jgi:hypothetical protein